MNTQIIFLLESLLLYGIFWYSIFVKGGIVKNNYKLGESDTRPWGQWEVTAVGTGNITKRIEVNPGEILSLQRHVHREELWVIKEGQGQITLDGETINTVVGNEYRIPKQTWHRIQNIGDVRLVFVETQIGDILDEADIERKEDKYSRK